MEMTCREALNALSHLPEIKIRNDSSCNPSQLVTGAASEGTMYVRVITVSFALATFVFAAAMFWLDLSATALAGNLRHFLGTFLMIVFIGLGLWGMCAAAWAYTTEKAKIDIGLTHLSMVQDIALNVGVLGSLAGILIMVTNLADAAEQGVSAFNSAVPGVLSGLVLKLSSAMTGYTIALKFGTIAKHAELRARIAGILSVEIQSPQSDDLVAKPPVENKMPPQASPVSPKANVPQQKWAWLWPNTIKPRFQDREA
jgi:hypothetical protein